jgi:hypothetical protein
MSTTFHSITALGLRYRLADFEKLARRQLLHAYPRCASRREYRLHNKWFSTALAALTYDRCPLLRQDHRVFEFDRSGRKCVGLLCDEPLALRQLFHVPWAAVVYHFREPLVVATTRRRFLLTNVESDPYGTHDVALSWSRVASVANTVGRLAQTLSRLGLPQAIPQLITFRHMVE